MVDQNELHLFLWNQVTHVFSSIALADQKATWLCAINTGAIYMVTQTLFDGKDVRAGKSHLFLISVLLLVCGVGLCFISVFPHAGIADAHVADGELLRPDRATDRTIVRNYEDYKRKVRALTGEQITNQLTGVVYSRMEIRKWKYNAIKAALALSLLGHFFFAIGFCKKWRHLHRMVLLQNSLSSGTP